MIILEKGTVITRDADRPIIYDGAIAAEARFLRGYFYFELVKNFGGVPLITGFLLPEEIQGITRASAEDVYKFIEDDLKAAAGYIIKTV